MKSLKLPDLCEPKIHVHCIFVKQMVNAIACTSQLWYTREVAKHERSVRDSSFLSA